MKSLQLLLVYILFASCVKDYKSYTRTFFNNKTSHKVEICPYVQGMKSTEDYKLINPIENRMVFEMSVRGKTLSPDFGTLLQPYDSIEVILDDTVKSVHLKFNTTIQNGKYIFYDSTRAISNPDNYIKTVDKEHRKYLQGYHTYTFTEQDYLDAKN